MGKHQNKQADTCPVARSVELIGDRWSLLIVRDAFNGTRRFSSFQRDLGVARSILTDRLRGLVDAGIFTIQPASDGTSYLEYVLTPAGKRLFPVVVALRQWGEQHLFQAGETHSQLIETGSGKPLGLMQPTAQDGRVLLPEETQVQGGLPS
ncbi:HxlR family transcriptional regulator [Chania multitudinisentens RB-25]|uniref:HxlR family transcriptional regulator n=1 Tax=Chania multitudinisentens RB-25 TaxID=1441930 RepID=W0L9C5_9GAMM|nr:helix-turn-helix domain-containing protein [Chania multitudinisentens]AHG18605.1 HxlR family transcriptional regulator [Chania multitudinisentens RB-25]